MENYFRTSPFFLNSEVESLVHMNDFESLRKRVIDNQAREKEEEIDINIKRIDCFIMNAYLCKQLAETVVTEVPIHKIYNTFFDQISESKELNSLFKIEQEMVYQYLNRKIYESEVTSNYTINRIIRYVFINLESELKVDKIARNLSLSKTYVSQVFKKETGRSLKSFITEQKLIRSKRLLETTPMKISEISDSLSFYDSSQFIRLFKKKYGLTPVEYRSHL